MNGLRVVEVAKVRGTAVKEFQIRNETNEIYVPIGPGLGDSVIQVESLSKKFDDKLLIDNLSFEIIKTLWE